MAQVKHYGADEYAQKKEIGYFTHVVHSTGAAAGYFFTSGQVGTNARQLASAAKPAVIVVAGQAFWKLVEAQRNGGTAKLVKPTVAAAGGRRFGCAPSLFTLGLFGRGGWRR